MDRLIFKPGGHVYLYDGKPIPSTTQILRAVGLIDFRGIDQEILERSAAFGTAVHQATALDDEGDLDWDSLDEPLKPYVEAWRAFQSTLKVGPSLLWAAIEQPLCHPDLGFAGTPDRLGDRMVVDLKTGTTVYPSTGLQLAAYSILADMPTARRVAVQLKPDGKFSAHEFTSRKDREVFLAALSVYQWRSKNA